MNLARFRVLATRELDAADHARRFRRNASWRAARWVAAVPGLHLGLRRALSAAVDGACGLYLHPSWAERALARGLEREVDPRCIRRYLPDWLELDGRRWHTSDYFVIAGPIDDVVRHVGAGVVHREATELHAYRLEHRATPAYEALVRSLEHGEVVTRQHRDLRTRADVDEYFGRFVALFRSIEQQGVVRRAAGRDRDIGVALGPWGDLVRLPGGQHRLAIASVLGLERIPVQIRMVHADLLRRRMDGRGLGPVAALDSLFANPCDSVVTA